VLYPVTALRAALKAAEETLAGILNNGHQRDSLGRMLTRQQLYNLLDYDGFVERDRTFFK
jgi:methylisocitrate lyase